MTYRFLRDGKLDREPLLAELERFLNLVLHGTQLEVNYEIRTLPSGAQEITEEPEILVAFRGRDQDLLLERNGQLLQALEYLAVRWLRLAPHFYDHLRFDCAGYRAMRLEELKLSAQVAAERVRETRQAFRFNPMPARERRVIHLALKDAPGVRTSSEGVGAERQVVIYPAEPK
jgi:spoIIIJ-associated protein